MESMKKEQLIRELSNYGYDMVSPGAGNPQQVLVQLVQSDDGRILEGFSVVLTNMLQKYPALDLAATEKQLDRGLQKRYRTLVAITYNLLSMLPDARLERDKLLDYLKVREPSLVEAVMNKIREGSEVLVGNRIRLDIERLKKTFQNYIVEVAADQREDNLTRLVEAERNAALIEALSELFTEKQKELIFRVLNKEKLSKTDREYFSRIVRKRLKAIRNSDLQSLAEAIVGF